MNYLLLAKKKKAIENFNRGNFDAAEIFINQVCQKVKQDAESWYMLGLINANKGQHERAADAFQRVIKTGDNNKYIRDASVNLGVALLAQEKFKQSRDILEQVIAKHPDEEEAFISLVIPCLKLKDYDKALEYAETAIKLAPKQPLAHQNYGVICSRLEKYDLAEEAFEKAIGLDRNVIQCYYNYVRMLGHAKQYSRAVDLCETILNMSPGNKWAFDARLKFKMCRGYPREALHEYRQLMQDGVIDIATAIGYLLDIQYDDITSPDTIFETHRQWGIAYSNSNSKKLPNTQKYRRNNESNTKLRVAYISPDFRNHSVAYFIEPILRYHDRDQVEVYCFAHLETTDATTSKLKSLADRWYDITLLQDLEVVKLMRSENIDIAVDLAGHTKHGKLKVLSHRVAPVQLTYLGYPATTGLAEMDYRLVDAQTDPEGYDQFATEELVRIPDCFLCYSNVEILTLMPDSRKEPTLGEAQKSITFGSFNNPLKISGAVIKTWSAILHKVDNSRLMMKFKSFGDREVCNRYIELFNKHGIESSQLDFMGNTKSTKEHMQHYAKIDIALDCFPYNGTTTTCEAMWMGVPVITLCGDRHSARVGSSLLNAIGSPEWIAQSEEDYINIATALASDPQRLKSIRLSLRKQMQESMLCDGPGFVSKIEAIYKTLHQKNLANHALPSTVKKK